MSPAYYSSLAIVAYMALFAAVGVAFLFANLLVGKFVRPANPHPEKLEIYECGEPTIGSSFVQFDLRFYALRKDGVYAGGSLWSGPVRRGAVVPAQFAVNDGGKGRLENCVTLLQRN